MALLSHVSRRQFLKYGASSLALASFVAGAERVTPAPGAASERDNLLIDAATDAAQHMRVTVQINGTGPYRFVVDTGADRSVRTCTATPMRPERYGRCRRSPPASSGKPPRLLW